jgi:hypothetical protein
MVLAAAMTLAVCAGSERCQGDDNYAFTHDIGDTSPGGGVAFYRTAAAFGDDWYYLEAAPESINGTKAWGSIGHTSTSIAGAGGTAIGTGKANTDAILVVDVKAPAAKACADYNTAGKDDWFLPVRTS